MIPSDRRRRRNIGACDLCRSRRTKYDGSRLKCRACAQRNVDCIYHELPKLPQSRLEVDISTIRNRLDSIEKVLSSAHERWCSQTNCVPVTMDVPSSGWAGEQNGRVDSASEDRFASSSLPLMMVRNGAFMDLARLKHDLARCMVDAERAVVPISPEKCGLFFGDFNPTCALAGFFNKIHIWYPILGVQLRDKLFCTREAPRAPSERCLYLILVAIGSLAQDDSLPAALRDRPDAPLMERALALLPTVLLESSLMALQCLIFLSTYYLCLVKPCQAHDYILIASMRAQNLLKSGNIDPESEELVRRAFWAIFLIEIELTVQLDLASSGIWAVENEVRLPSWSQLGDGAPPSPSVSPGSPPGHWFGSPDSSSQLLSYFLAEIAMRRMLQRCTKATRRLPGGKQIFAPVIATELELQLEKWHSYLPEFLRFDRICVFGRDDSNPNLLFLRAQYYAYRLSIQ